MSKTSCFLVGCLVMLLICGSVCVNATPSAMPLGGRGLEVSFAEGHSQGSGPILLASRGARKRWKKKTGISAIGRFRDTGMQIDPNTASQKCLTLLPLVDVKTAKAIIANRPYMVPEDLIKVPGIGPRRFRVFKHLIVIAEPEESVVEVEEITTN